ncbi:MAG: hypothetical protein LUQ25_06415 [Methanoregulaceae archaeon]|nr:hypothetical protein [Methanoregulaceae archaeon]
MATRTCPNCKSKVSGDSCRYCGYRFRKEGNFKPLMGIILIVIALAVVALIVWHPPGVPCITCGSPPTPPQTFQTATATTGTPPPQPPAPPLSVIASRQGNTIVIRNMGGPGLPYVNNFTVTVNNMAQAQKLSTSTGSSISLPGQSTQDAVVVVAHFNDNTSRVLLNTRV